MNVTCSVCATVFRVDPTKVPQSGVRARCTVCGQVFPLVPRAALGQGGRTAPARPPVDVVTAGPDVEPPNDRTTRVAEASAASPPTADAPAGATLQRDVSAGAARATAAAPAAAPARRVNPYLSNTPDLRARRLARALVSDLVAYHPQKREDGMRDGTLKQLFREEIRKSWDEYVAQVGASVAESTPHFQDALNDVLAGGRRIF